jgi:hypothetical protein
VQRYLYPRRCAVLLLLLMLMLLMLPVLDYR